jgi:hypothetical protein
VPPPAPPPAAPPPAAPPPQAPPPATVQPPAPVAAAPAGPSAATRAARRRAAAARARRARRKAARLRAARIAAAKEAERRKLAADRVTAAANREGAAVASAEPSGTNALPLLLAGLVVAAVLLGLALTPARVVPSSRAARLLEDKREEVAVLAAMGLFATGLFFLFVTVVAK